MTRSPGQTRDDAGLPAPAAAPYRRDIRLLVPGTLLTLAAHPLAQVGGIWAGVFALTASPAVLVMWAIREAG